MILVSMDYASRCGQKRRFHNANRKEPTRISLGGSHLGAGIEWKYNDFVASLKTMATKRRSHHGVNGRQYILQQALLSNMILQKMDNTSKLTINTEHKRYWTGRCQDISGHELVLIGIIKLTWIVPN